MTPPLAPDAIHAAASAWRIGPDRALSLDQPRIMGILNVTPDSFSDGGAYPTTNDALRCALRMIDEGASIIDIGGESTRPGAAAVPADEQIRRTIPVIAALRAHHAAATAAISIDTTLASVAQAALDAGANIINDISAGRDDGRMFALAAERRCGMILMHRMRLPREDSYSTHYAHEPDYGGDVYGVVRAFLQQRVDAAHDAGVDRAAMVIDPGLGFGKSVVQNYHLAVRLGDLQRELNLPALSAASRKSFLARPPANAAADDARLPSIAASHDLPPRERLGASIAMTLSHWQMGVRLFRVHDVAAHQQALRVAAAMREQSCGVAG